MAKGEHTEWTIVPRNFTRRTSTLKLLLTDSTHLFIVFIVLIFVILIRRSVIAHKSRFICYPIVHLLRILDVRSAIPAVWVDVPAPGSDGVVFLVDDLHGAGCDERVEVWEGCGRDM
jgi:hypothetical protein